mmetsp:Transcript_5256/g.6987  ORF Transcript_5256/g.6987 Transcript_5256/m.6987 type:complete len:664 (-) Transcript_5256:119-2110(-)
MRILLHCNVAMMALALSIILDKSGHVNAWSSSSLSPLSLKTASSAAAFAPSSLKMTAESTSSDEQTLRDELSRKNSELVGVKDESQFAVLDEQRFGVPEEDVEKMADAAAIPAELQKSIDRALKPRAYPLFLMEKAGLILEDILSSSKSNGSSSATTPTKKEKIVVLGTGWGAAAFLKDIDMSLYDVTVVSPRNFFLFTPMLAGASVGTVEYRSITEPVREINPKAKYVEATASSIDTHTNAITCESVVCEGNSCTINEFELNYDKLVYAVGAQTNTFGIPGVREYCCFLKQIEDAQKVRNAIINCFERAALPGLSEEEMRKILTFAVIGAGPTGVEFASELRDFIENDGPKYYPELLKYTSIKVIEASSTVLMPFDKSLQEEAIKQLTRGVTPENDKLSPLLPKYYEFTELLLDSGVSEVKDDVILLNNGKTIPYGVAVWAAGNGPLPVTLQLIEDITKSKSGRGASQEEAQSVARGRLAIDPWLRVLGCGGDILSLGDCSCITAGQLPATAQVASQQGEYLAKLLSNKYDMNPSLSDYIGSSNGDAAASLPSGTLLPPKRDAAKSQSIVEKVTSFAIQNDDFAAPFQFLNLGILAYTGAGSALAQLQVTPAQSSTVKGKGKIGFGLWRSVYISKQVSWRNRFLVLIDWTTTKVFGRDITRL